MQFIESSIFILGLLTLLLIGQVVAFILLKKVFDKFKTTFKGAEEMPILKMLEHVSMGSENLEREVEKLTKEAKEQSEILKTTVQKVGIVRFNPFNDMGGEQSFCIVLLNEENDGILLTNLYGKDDNRAYAKKVEKGKTQQQLSEEEEKVLSQAMSS
ncbi:MAG: DUF4446 family protein [Candidatus Spechtbacterales bacterium]